MNAAIATILRPTKWNNDYAVVVADENGNTIIVKVSDNKEAAAHIKSIGATKMNKPAFYSEVDYRIFAARRSADVYYNYATNG